MSTCQPSYVRDSVAADSVSSAALEENEPLAEPSAAVNVHPQVATNVHVIGSQLVVETMGHGVVSENLNALLSGRLRVWSLGLITS